MQIKTDDQATEHNSTCQLSRTLETKNLLYIDTYTYVYIKQKKKISKDFKFRSN